MKLPWFFSILLALALTTRADDMHFESAGVRGGFGHGRDDRAFLSCEVFGKVALPWRWSWGAGSDWGLQTGLDLSVGVLQRDHEASLMVQAGPCCTIGSRDFPLAFVLGSNPTLLSDHYFDEKDLGSTIQFTSYFGLEAKLGNRFGLGYRFQHISNFGLGDPNPGLNTHVISLGYRF